MKGHQYLIVAFALFIFINILLKKKSNFPVFKFLKQKSVQVAFGRVQQAMPLEVSILISTNWDVIMRLLSDRNLFQNRTLGIYDYFLPDFLLLQIPNSRQVRLRRLKMTYYVRRMIYSLFLKKHPSRILGLRLKRISPYIFL